MDKVTYTPIPDWILRDGILSTTELYIFSYMYKGWCYALKQGNKYQVSASLIAKVLEYKDDKIIRRCISKMLKCGILSVERGKNGDCNIYEFNTEKVFFSDAEDRGVYLDRGGGLFRPSGGVNLDPHKEINNKEINNIKTIDDIVPRSEGNSKTQSELEIEHYDEVIRPQLERIKKWQNDPEPDGYKNLSEHRIIASVSDFPKAAEWFKESIRENVTDEEWYRYFQTEYDKIKSLHEKELFNSVA